jgi:membrane associated rhomboid family serine protease
MIDYAHWPQEPWRLATACLLHANWMHLVFNLLWMWRLGQCLEPIFGLASTLGLYLLFGAGASAAQWAFRGSSIGLSGVVYGMFGLLWALNRFHPSYRGVMDKRTTNMFVGWFFLCVAMTYLRWFPVANIAHGVGAILGGLVGMSLSPFPQRRATGRLALGATIALVTLLSTVGRPYVNFSKRRAGELAYDAYEAIEAGDYPRAIELLQRSVARDPEFAHAWHNLGYAYQELGLIPESRAALEREQDLQTGLIPDKAEPPSLRDWQGGWRETERE